MHEVNATMAAVHTATDFLRARADRAREAYEGKNMLLRGNGRVHAVSAVEWLDGIEAPAAACHASNATGPMVGAIPTERAVNCRRCLGARPIKRPPRDRPRASAHRAPNPAQAVLAGLEM